MRAVIAEDSVLLREGLERLLTENDIQVLETCDSADALLSAVRSRSPDVAVVDIRLPPTHNDEGLARRPRDPCRTPVHTRVCAVAVRRARTRDETAVRFHRRCRLPAQGSHQRRPRVRVGHPAGWPQVGLRHRSEHHCDPARQAPHRRPHREPHTPERQVLEHMAQGRSNEGIADKLVITASRRREARLQRLRQARASLGCERFTTCPCSTAVPALLNRRWEYRVWTWFERAIGGEPWVDRCGCVKRFQPESMAAK